MKKILITGATSGFGKLLVRRFLDNNYIVFATGRNLPNRKEIFAKERKKHGNSLIELPLNVEDKQSIGEAFAVVQSHTDKIDILANNAGYGVFGPLEEMSEQSLRTQMEVNFFGTVFITQAFLPLLRRARGKIFNVSSVFGFMGFPLTSLYCASKFAVEGLTESLRGELQPHGVQVCLIEPGGYHTNFNQNSIWPNIKSDSVYSQQMSSYRSFHKKVFRYKNAQDPDEVAKGIFTLSQKSQIPMRATFGRDARIAKIARRGLPSKIYYSTLNKIFNKVFANKDL